MAKAILTQPELDHLADVIGEIEKTTAGEIRLMIVQRSSVTGHVFSVLFSCLVGISLVVTLLLLNLRDGWHWPAILVADGLAAWLLAKLPFIQRNLTRPADLIHQVWARAEVEFHREGLSGTRSHTGVLIFLSLMERSALVLADKGISSKVPPHTWDKVIDIVLSGARTGRWSVKLEQALRECGSYLAAHFPPGKDKGNELPNAVIVKD